MSNDLIDCGVVDQAASTQDRISPMSTSTPITPSPRRSSWYSTKQWEEVETIVYPFDTLDGEKLACFQAMRDVGVPCHVLLSVASLIAKFHGTLLVSARSTKNRNGTTSHFMVVGSFLVNSCNQHLKLAIVELLMMELLPPVFREEDEEAVQDTLDYILGHDFGWNTPVHSQLPLFVRLKETCQVIKRQQEQSLQFKRQTVAKVVRGSDVAADVISSAALAVETGLKWSVPVLTGTIDSAGNLMKRTMTPPKEEPPKTRSAVVAATYTDAAKRATDGVRVGTRAAVHGIRDASTQGIQQAALKFEKEGLGEKLVPDQDQRDVICAAGKVGVASLGAVAIVGEAVYHTTSAVLQKTASVTADVVRHKYGDSAGQIVQDASDTTGNVLRTVAQVAMLEGKVLTKSVAKNTSKQRVRQGESPTLKESTAMLTKMITRNTEALHIQDGNSSPVAKELDETTAALYPKSDARFAMEKMDKLPVSLGKHIASETSFARSNHDRT